MNRPDIQSGIVRAWKVAVSLGLGETISTPAPLSVNDEFRDSALSSESQYHNIYLLGLRLSYYNFLISDYSFFQFSWFTRDHVRYAYYPNPFISSESDLADLRHWRDMLATGFISLDDYLDVLRDSKPGIGVPPIRYENATGQHRGLQHPCSHFHIGHHEDNRWASNRVITPLAFTLLVLKQYYGAVWREVGTDSSDEFGNRFESKLIQEKMNCRPMDYVLFLPAEARSFFFS